MTDLTVTVTVIGVDPSISATGLALSDGSLITVGGKADRGDERLLDIACVMGTALTQADLVVMEDLPTHAHGAGITGMVQGVVRLMCLRASVPYVLISPATLKKWATGAGNAGKADMRMALYKRTGMDLRDDNQCDAWWLRAAGLEHLGQPVVDMPAAHVKALSAVTWPTLPAAAA
jgi:Holliday junction resolvasome RuvABC endonuclease subunit